MSKPPLLSGREIVRALQRAGFVVVHQRGSHVKLRHRAKDLTVIVPDHPEVDRWLLKGVLRDAEISLNDFLKVV